MTHPAHSAAFVALVDDARTRVAEIAIADVQAKLAAQDDFVLVDVREDHEWQAGHIPSALHIGRGVLERDVEAVIPDKSALVVLYCGGGFRSALAADNMQKMGYTAVLSMAGGIRGWKALGAPCELPGA